jgi:hypothetical protein
MEETHNAKTNKPKRTIHNKTPHHQRTHLRKHPTTHHKPNHRQKNIQTQTLGNNRPKQQIHPKQHLPPNNPTRKKQTNIPQTLEPNKHHPKPNNNTKPHLHTMPKPLLRRHLAPRTNRHQTGIKQDLNKVFNEDHQTVNDILTLAMFPYLTKHTYNHVARWQKTTKTPSTTQLTPTQITRLTQTITEQHRLDLLKLRAQKLNKDELCAIDSTTRTAYGTRLADIRWGKNKEHLPLPQTIEIVVYSLTSHMPVFYQSFPGNMPDTKSFETILKVLQHAGFKTVIYITDRGYDSLHNLLCFISKGQAFVMCVKTGQRDVLKVIKELGDFGTRPRVWLLILSREFTIVSMMLIIKWEIKILRWRGRLV